MKVSLKKSVSLVELLISISLLGVIALGAIAFHLSSERFLTSSERKTQVLNELIFILQHLQKNILIVTGSADNPGMSVVGKRLKLDQDTQTAEYSFNPAGKVIRFRIDAGGWERLTSRFVNSGFGFDIVDGGVEITNLALRFNPDLPKDDSTNPEVTTIDSGGNRTVFFYSLSHSW